MKKCKIGGQAVLEGVMMKSPTAMAIAVRKSDGTIEISGGKFVSIREKYPILKLPVLRGVLTFGESMVLGIKSLMTSAEIYGEEEAEGYQPSKFEKFISEKTGKDVEDVMIFFAVFLAIIFAIGLFIGLPTLVVSLLKPLISTNLARNITEGLVRITIFIIYILLISKMKDIRRVFEYHGAEHKTIHCYEHDEELTVENARKYTTLHPRCGTAFLLIVMVISILAFSFLGWHNIFIRIITRISLLPLVAGLAYEVTRWAGSSSSRLVGIIMYPGLMLQKLTTREPDDQQLEVAIAAFLAATEGFEEVEAAGENTGCPFNGTANAGVPSVSPGSEKSEV